MVKPLNQIPSHHSPNVAVAAAANLSAVYKLIAGQRACSFPHKPEPEPNLAKTQKQKEGLNIKLKRKREETELAKLKVLVCWRISLGS